MIFRNHLIYSILQNYLSLKWPIKHILSVKEITKTHRIYKYLIAYICGIDSFFNPRGIYMKKNIIHRLNKLSLFAAGTLLLAACNQTGGEANASGADTAAGSESSDIVQASFNEDGSVNIPTGYRQWVFMGAPLTPNALNGGEAPFPEFHNVYIEPSAFAAFEATGEFPEGTQIVKELTTVRSNNNAENGSSQEVSGVGYFQGEFAGLELTVKDNDRFKDEPGGWAYFSFGHKSPPYEKTATAFPAESCNACHEASAETDFVFTQFYPVLRAAKK